MNRTIASIIMSVKIHKKSKEIKEKNIISKIIDRKIKDKNKEKNSCHWVDSNPGPLVYKSSLLSIALSKLGHKESSNCHK